MSSTGAPATESLPTSIDAAVAFLDAAETREEEAPAEAAPQTEQITEAEPAAEGASEPETATEGEPAEPEGEAAEGAEPELPPIEPPRFWDADAKKRFGELSRDLQEFVLAKETERDKATAKALEEAALKRKAADGEASKLAQITGNLDKLLPQAQSMFNDKWANVDWNAVVDQYGAEQALKLRNQMEAERGVVQQLSAAKAEADAVATNRFVAERLEQLKTVCPDLTDGKAGAERQLKLVQFLTEQGLSQDTIVKRASAAELAIAYDAMRWRQAQADAKAKASAPKIPAQTKAATQPKPTVRPTAAPARAGSPQHARLQQLERKGRLSMDEGVELLTLREELNR